MLRLIRRLRRSANVTVVITLAVVCVVIASATGFWLLFRLAYVVALGLPLIYLWTRSMSRGLDVEVTRRSHSVTQDRPIEGRIVVRSRSRLPKVWLEVEDASTLPGHVSQRVLTLGPNANRRSSRRCDGGA